MSGTRGEERTAVLTLFYFVIFFVIAADQITKYVAQSFLSSVSTVPIIPNVFHLTLVYNKGIAFGLFRDHDLLLILLITGSLGILFFLSRRIHQIPPMARWGLSLILGGAVGNWIDRIRLGYVIDFLDFRIWPVFNLADTVISIGVGLYLIHTLKPQKTTA